MPQPPERPLWREMPRDFIKFVKAKGAWLAIIALLIIAKSLIPALNYDEDKYFALSMSNPESPEMVAFVEANASALWFSFAFMTFIVIFSSWLFMVLGLKVLVPQSNPQLSFKGFAVWLLGMAKKITAIFAPLAVIIASAFLLTSLRPQSEHTIIVSCVILCVAGWTFYAGIGLILLEQVSPLAALGRAKVLKTSIAMTRRDLVRLWSGFISVIVITFIVFAPLVLLHGKVMAMYGAASAFAVILRAITTGIVVTVGLAALAIYNCTAHRILLQEQNDQAAH